MSSLLSRTWESGSDRCPDSRGRLADLACILTLAKGLHGILRRLAPRPSSTQAPQQQVERERSAVTARISRTAKSSREREREPGRNWSFPLRWKSKQGRKRQEQKREQQQTLPRELGFSSGESRRETQSAFSPGDVDSGPGQLVPRWSPFEPQDQSSGPRPDYPPHAHPSARGRFTIQEETPPTPPEPSSHSHRRSTGFPFPYISTAPLHTTSAAARPSRSTDSASSTPFHWPILLGNTSQPPSAPQQRIVGHPLASHQNLNDQPQGRFTETLLHPRPVPLPQPLPPSPSSSVTPSLSLPPYSFPLRNQAPAATASFGAAGRGGSRGSSRGRGSARPALTSRWSDTTTTSNLDSPYDEVPFSSSREAVEGPSAGDDGERRPSFADSRWSRSAPSLWRLERGDDADDEENAESDDEPWGTRGRTMTRGSGRSPLLQSHVQRPPMVSVSTQTNTDDLMAFYCANIPPPAPPSSVASSTETRPLPVPYQSSSSGDSAFLTSTDTSIHALDLIHPLAVKEDLYGGAEVPTLPRLPTVPESRRTSGTYGDRSSRERILKRLSAIVGMVGGDSAKVKAARRASC